MKGMWPTVRLGDVLTPVVRREAVDATKEYSLLGVRLAGQGPFLRETVSGAETAARTLYRVCAGDFIYSRLFACRGAFGVIAADLDGCYVSGEFPVYAPVADRVCVEYLRYWFRLPSVIGMVGDDCSGSTPLTRNRFKEQFFLGLEIPLPPLSEQRRIVGRIEELAGEIEAARRLRAEAVKEAEAVIDSVLHGHFARCASRWQSMPMTGVIEIGDRQVDPTLPQYSGLPHISGENMERGTCRLLPWQTAEQDGVKSGNYLFGPGTVLYSKIRPYLRKAVYVDFLGVCSADVYPLRVRSENVDPHFLKWALVAEPFTEYANRLSGRTRMPKLNRKQLFGFGFACPRLDVQRRIVAELDALQVEVDALQSMQSETAAEMDALLPSILDRAFKGELR